MNMARTQDLLSLSDRECHFPEYGSEEVCVDSALANGILLMKSPNESHGGIWTDFENFQKLTERGAFFLLELAETCYESDAKLKPASINSSVAQLWWFDANGSFG